MKAVRIIGIGSPFGDDRLGWLALERFRQERWAESYPGRVTLLTLNRPGLGLLHAMRGADAVFLVDGVRSGAPPGTLHRLRGFGWAPAEASLSSHGLGVAAAIRLADALGQLPRHLVLLGIEIANCHAAAALSRSTEQSLPELVRALAEELYRLRAEARQRGGLP